MLETPGVYKIQIKQGVTLLLPMTWSAGGVLVNLTGFAAKMQVQDDTGAILVTLTNGSGITLGGIAGTILLTIDASVTATFPVAEYAYDLRLTDSLGVVGYLIEGVFAVQGRVTT